MNESAPRDPTATPAAIHDGDVRTPIDPGPCQWELPSPDAADDDGFLGIGADLEPSTLLAAYCAGMFPMPFRRRSIGWWSPDPRGVLPLDGLRVTRSLRRSMSRYQVTRNRCFEAVMRECGRPERPQGWINDDIIRAYVLLHQMGWAHSIETWDGDRLVGGLYGVRIGAFFAGESMFSTAVDASKVALVHLVEWLRSTGATLLDVQWTTPHLASLGVVDVPRPEYLRLLNEAVGTPPGTEAGLA